MVNLFHRRFSSWFLAVASLFILVLVFFGGWFFGHRQGVISVVPQGEGRVLNQDQKPASWSEDVDFAMFWEVWDFAKENYYHQPVSDKELFYGAIKGMLAGLDDPYSNFFDPKEAEEFNGDLNGSFEGIGAQIDIDDAGQIIVVAPLPGTPAEQRGVQAGDKILAIDGVDTFGMTVEEAISKIRGPKGTDVTLTITRDGFDSATDIIITRDTIVVESVKLEMRDDGIAVVSMYLFGDDTALLFTSAINDLLAKGAKGLVLDLRSNPGGLLDQAIDVASVWTGEQTVVIQSVRGKNQAFVGSSEARLSGLPTIVLVDGGSASASEIVAGALQDYGLAKLVGTQTFGKGSVQDYRELDDGSSFKITTAEWLTPKERSINHVGITPDVIVEYTKEDAEADRDPQMEKAIELLK